MKSNAAVEEKEEIKHDTQKTDLNITKIKYDGKETEIHYRKWAGETGIDTKETIFKSPDLPHVDFITALENLVPEVIFILGLDEEYPINMQVRGVSLGQGAVITAVKKFPDYGNKAFCMNTFYLEFEEHCDQEKGGVPLPKRTEIAIKKLEEEAKAFMKGKRKNEQRKLELVPPAK